jgi:threonine/homoserine/homoserine lactone efflux protein
VPSTATLLGFAAVALAMVLTPGLNMIYLIGRSITQGRFAGYVSLLGVAAGFVVYMLAAAFGITALLFAVPHAYDALRFAGAAYLLWLAWQALRGPGIPLRPGTLPAHGTRKLFLMGLLTNLLNPKIAALYLALLPQFIDPAGDVLAQSLMLGMVQIAVSVAVNAAIVTLAGGVAAFLVTRPAWQRVQRWLMATVLAGLAIRLATERAR